MGRLNVAIVSSPIQYFLSRVAASRFPDVPLQLIVPLDHGDNRAVFADVDAVLGWSAVEMLPFRQGDQLAVGPIERLFSSNRFNPLEIEILRQLRVSTRHLCAYEDGLAIYSRRSPFNKYYDDTATLRVIKMLAKMKLRQFGLIRRNPQFLPFRIYDEVYSIFDGVPGMRHDARWFSVAESCRQLVGTRPAGEASECVFLSQCLTTDRMVEADDYVAFVAEVLERLRNRYEIVYYKAHPRDEPAVTARVLERVPCAQLQGAYGRIPMEIYSASRPDVDVYGFGTSALGYVAALYGVRAHTVIPAFRARFEVSPRLSAFWETSASIFRKANVTNVARLDEIGG